MVQILNECSFLKPEGIAKVEELHNCKYVFESCLRGKSGTWCNFPAAIFYSETPHPDGSNYMALYQDDGHFYVADGISAVSEDFSGLLVDDKIIYSRYRHDYRMVLEKGNENDAFIDGGRDYVRYDGGELVTLRVVKDKLEVIDA